MTSFSTYEVVKLKDYVYFQEGPGIRNSQNTLEGIRFLNIRCFVDGRLDTASMKKVSENEAYGKYKHFLLDVGDYVVSSSGTLGRIVEVYPEDIPVMLNTSTIRFRPIKNELLDRLYLRYFLESEVFQKQVKSLATGSVQLNYGSSHLAFVEMPLPPIKSQRAIGKVLDNLTKQISLNHALSKTLEEVAQTIFKSWFIDFDPVKAKMDGEKPIGMDDETAALFPDSFEESELGLIPKEWKVGELADSFNLVMGQSPPGDTYNKIGVGLPFYQGSTHFGHRFPSVNTFCTVEKRLANKGDTLLCVRANVGLINQAYEKCILGRGVASILHKLNLPSYTYRLMKFIYGKISADSFQGSVILGLTSKDLLKYKILEPPDELVVEMNNVLNSIDKMILLLFHQNSQLISMRDSLLPRLISGELRIPEELLAS